LHHRSAAQCVSNRIVVGCTVRQRNDAYSRLGQYVFDHPLDRMHHADDAEHMLSSETRSAKRSCHHLERRYRRLQTVIDMKAASSVNAVSVDGAIVHVHHR